MRKGSRDRVDASRYAGGARAEFIAEARRLVRECDEGRAPSACFLELKTALARFDARKPVAQGRPTP